MEKYFTVCKISMSHGRKNLLGSFLNITCRFFNVRVHDDKKYLKCILFILVYKLACLWACNGPFTKTYLKTYLSVSMNFLNSINIDDVSQGDVGDCWLLSSIIAVVNFGQNLINDIICLEENLKNPNGPFKFKFHKCGKWHSGKG